jgi:hypothetical protein
MPAYTLEGAPTAIRHDPEGNSWIITQPGKVYKNGAVFLDIHNKLVALNPFYDERGLLGIALHPKISNRYYLMYTAPGTSSLLVNSGSNAPDTKWNEARYTTLLVLEEYEGQRPLRKLLEIKHPGMNHNGKDAICFRPSDGALVWALGDDGYEYDLYNLAQRDEFLGGKILALDISVVPDSMGPISRTTALPTGVVVESKGLRNPVSLQHVPMGERELTFVTCPGQGRFEWAFAFEGKGQNFGWRTYEGPERTKFPFGSAPFKDQDFPYYHPFLYYTHHQINSPAGNVTTGGRLVGDKFYFLDWRNGLYRCQPNLDNLQTPVTFEKFIVPTPMKTYTSLGQEGELLWLGGLLNGKGYAYSFPI